MNNYYLQVSKLVLRQWFLNCASESRGGLGRQEGQGIKLAFVNTLSLCSISTVSFTYFILELPHEFNFTAEKWEGRIV